MWSRNLKTEEAKIRKWVVKASKIIIIFVEFDQSCGWVTQIRKKKVWFVSGPSDEYTPNMGVCDDDVANLQQQENSTPAHALGGIKIIIHVFSMRTSKTVLSLKPIKQYITRGKRMSYTVVAFFTVRHLSDTDIRIITKSNRHMRLHVTFKSPELQPLHFVHSTADSRTAVFWNVTSHNFVDSYRRFGGICCFCLQGRSAPVRKPNCTAPYLKSPPRQETGRRNVDAATTPVSESTRRQLQAASEKDILSYNYST
jgi:hypothetical protein